MRGLRPILEIGDACAISNVEVGNTKHIRVLALTCGHTSKIAGMVGHWICLIDFLKKLVVLQIR